MCLFISILCVCESEFMWQEKRRKMKEVVVLSKKEREHTLLYRNWGGEETEKKKS